MIEQVVVDMDASDCATAVVTTSENTTNSASQNADELRLGKCEVCNFNASKYTCPKCEVKTCSLPCIQIHKKELDCNGIRDRTKYVPMRQLTENDLMSDYTFLEQCTQYVNNRKQDSIKRYSQFNRTVPVHLSKLEAAAAERSIKLKFLLQNFTKNKLNTTYYDWKSKVIFWRVEWHFVNADDAKFVDERCDEQSVVRMLLEQRVAANGVAGGDGALRLYEARGMENVRVLLKAEGIRKSKNRYYELDVEKSLRDNLTGKTIVEFPVLAVVHGMDADAFDIIDSDEEDVVAETRKHEDAYFKKSLQKRKYADEPAQASVTPVAASSEGEPTAKAKLPQNLLFTDESIEWDGISDGSDEA